MIQCDSKFTQSLLAQNFRNQWCDKTYVCPGYVDTIKFFKEHISRLDARKKLGHPCWQTEDVCFFTLRRHAPRMGIENFIRAYHWVRPRLNSDINFRIIVGGKGPLTGQLHELVESLNLRNNVFFTGEIPNEEIVLHYRAADCFVLPSFSMECFGLIILEAFASGTPVIATPVGAIPETLGPFAAESLSEATEPESIGRKMLEFLQDRRSQRSELDYREFASRFEKKLILNHLEKIVVEA